MTTYLRTHNSIRKNTSEILRYQNSHVWCNMTSHNDPDLLSFSYQDSQGNETFVDSDTVEDVRGARHDFLRRTLDSAMPLTNDVVFFDPACAFNANTSGPAVDVVYSNESESLQKSSELLMEALLDGFPNWDVDELYLNENFSESGPFLASSENMYSEDAAPMDGNPFNKKTTPISFQNSDALWSGSDKKKLSTYSHEISGEVSPSKRRYRSSALTIEDIERNYSKSLVDASRELGLSVTMLKKACRRFGIRRWPHRKVASIDRMIDQMNSCLLNWRQNTPLNLQDPNIFKVVQDRIEFLERKKEAICHATTLGIYPGKPSSKDQEIQSDTEISTEVTSIEVDFLLDEFSISLEREKNQELITTVNNYRSSLPVVPNKSSFPSEARSKLIVPVPTPLEKPLTLNRQNSRHDMLQNQFETPSPREQLMLLHQHALQMISHPSNLSERDEIFLNTSTTYESSQSDIEESSGVSSGISSR